MYIAVETWRTASQHVVGVMNNRLCLNVTMRSIIKDLNVRL